ncbi:MAG: transposase [Candidatus Thiodiazotropha sp. (ex Lucinoma aequizonata)]|nr:transposase [Candidatus Thiodiazotropha sp. (ex Lucinoma aequizonata)]MCU7896655.1 transposase [Candidatus Thiodiazotropha sp. (ex Lucinoma aequizonata)]MCU7899308.1 transposase [Candidatus Thiodiazotropha sp. (ex Lucinoma aequizonata)]MCU7908849.1 transposase [Candidatus Thiodiazotropha sp. (ex Lucinoma aequizonata)]
MEGTRRATGDSTAGATTGTPVRPDPEVPKKRQQRQYTAAYKKQILKKANRYIDSRQISAMLRREGLYLSNLTTWRRQREAGTLAGLKPHKQEPKAQPMDPMKKQVKALQRENRRLNEELRKAEIIIDVQKKVSELLGNPLSPNPDGGKR